MISIQSNKQDFITLCKNYIHRKGITELLNWLDYQSDFFIAPASSRFHLAEEGGLCQHSLNVASRMLKNYDIDFSNSALVESILIVSLFHDLCKVNFYDKRIGKNGTYYTIDSQGELYGHGHKSARLVSKYIDISDDEYTAIVYHMGFTSDEVKLNPSLLNDVFNHNDLAVNVHIADVQATFIDEKEEDK